MGLIVLHSGHASKIFRKVCGTNSVSVSYTHLDGGRLQKPDQVAEIAHPAVKKKTESLFRRETAILLEILQKIS